MNRQRSRSGWPPGSPIGNEHWGGRHEHELGRVAADIGLPYSIPPVTG